MENKQIIDIEVYTKSNQKPPVGHKYKVKVGEEYIVFDHHIVTGREILLKAGNAPVECYALYQKLKHCDFEKIDHDEKVDLTREEGIEQFVVKQTEVFQYTVDAEPETTDQKRLTPNQILELAGITPLEDYYLVLINPDGSQVNYRDIPNDPIIMRCPAMKFISVFRGETPVS